MQPVHKVGESLQIIVDVKMVCSKAAFVTKTSDYATPENFLIFLWHTPWIFYPWACCPLHNNAQTDFAVLTMKIGAVSLKLEAPPRGSSTVSKLFARRSTPWLTPSPLPFPLSGVRYASFCSDLFQVSRCSAVKRRFQICLS